MLVFERLACLTLFDTITVFFSVNQLHPFLRCKVTEYLPGDA